MQSPTDNDRSRLFVTLMLINFNRQLKEEELGFYAHIYNRYDEAEILQAVDLFLEKHKGERFVCLPRPKELRELIEGILKQREIESIGTDDCRICGSTGEALVMWAGNDRCTRYDWHTCENSDGMRIVREQGEWRYSTLSVCPCSCAAGYKVWLKKKNVESFEAIKRIAAGGFLIGRESRRNDDFEERFRSQIKQNEEEIAF